MAAPIPDISPLELALTFVPPLMVVGLLMQWQGKARTGLLALVRMLVQLLAIGYVLVLLFDSNHPTVIGAVLLFMGTVAAWIATRTVETHRHQAFGQAWLAVILVSLPVLALITQVVIGVEPWYNPRYLIPLGGMVFSAAMNAVSLSAERLQAERERGRSRAEARRIALEAAMIPVTNTLLAVGLVALPGMMTGQILSGVSPLLAVKYQIVIMTMLFGVAGLSAALYLIQASRT
ncbi:MAG: ABC transporter permease [Gammaproteobacteria bacterium]|nr:MAG: ABC transporter permease [Gammaproteobacteria bacterium]